MSSDAPAALTGWPAVPAPRQGTTAPRRSQGLGALLWLRSRELLGESRDTTRLFVLVVALLSWGGLCWLGAWQAVHHGTVTGNHIGYLAAGAWPLWALLPLLGGGGGEVVAAQRLAAYPVGPRGVFGAAWLTALIDLPYLAVAPILIALNAAAFGWAGLIAVLCFTLGASGLGQVLAWVSSLTLAGRKRSGVTALLLTVAVVGLLAAAPRLLPGALGVAQVLPSGWLSAAERAAQARMWTDWLGLCALLAAPGALSLLAGPPLTGAALAREARAGGVGARPWGRASWWVRGSTLLALTVVAVRSMTRAVGAQVALAGVLAVPAITHLPGVDFAAVSLPAMGTVAAVATAVILAINAFAFDAGGAVLLFALPLPPRLLVASRSLAVGACLLAAQLAVTAVALVSIRPGATQLAEALVLDLTRTLALTGLGLVWSLLLPAASDYDSLRARVAPPRSILSFGAAAAIVSYTSSQGVHDVGASLGLPLAALASLAVLVVGMHRAARLIATGAGERVVAAVIS